MKPASVLRRKSKNGDMIYEVGQWLVCKVNYFDFVEGESYEIVNVYMFGETGKPMIGMAHKDDSIQWFQDSIEDIFDTIPIKRKQRISDFLKSK
jgi:hypothetical protein